MNKLLKQIILVSVLALSACEDNAEEQSVYEQRLDLAKLECASQGWTNWGKVVDLDTTKSFGMSDSLYNQLTLTWVFNLVTLRNVCTGNDTTVVAAFSWCNSCSSKEEFLQSITKENVMNVYTTRFYIRYDINGDFIDYDALEPPEGW